MCGCYNVSGGTAAEIGKLIRQADEKLYRECAAALKRIGNADIHPAEEAPVLLAAGGGITCAWLRWGFPIRLGQEKRLVFNARCESATDKPLFREGILHRRVAVPAAAFYEWDHGKTKFTFRKNDGKTLFMAGCCRHYGGSEHFVILTTGANKSMEPVHSRMPLLLEKDAVAGWILDSKRTGAVLREVPFLLERGTEFEQLRFF